MSSHVKDPGSFRDPAGFVFTHQGAVYRQVNECYRPHYDRLMSSGLYAELISKRWLIPHEEVELPLQHSEAYLYLKPEELSFISYPYEWSFDMLKDAALLTLRIAETALRFGMTLKDASAYNVQYHEGRMVFIDTLSFETWDKSKPWSPYRQFCGHFLAPLALMHHARVPMQGLQVGYPEGIPLEMVAALLPWKTRWNLHLYLHLHLNGSIRHDRSRKGEVRFSEQKMKNILKSLQAAITPLQLQQKGVWSDYYTEAAERDGYVENKLKVITQWLEGTHFRTAFDAGANDGFFSRLLAQKGIATIAGDGDHGAINRLYNSLKTDPAPIHPILSDLSYPSPALGVNNTERKSLLSRVQADLVLALALLHHLAIGKNIPFERLAEFFAGLGSTLIIEFVPREDPKVQLMLAGKPPIYDWYSEEAFKTAFATRFKFLRAQKIAPSQRTLFLLERL